MKKLVKCLCAVLAAALLFGIVSVPACAAEDTPEPQVTTAPTVPETTAPETLPPETTVPETEAPETVPPETEPERIAYTSVPLFYQDDYGDMIYADGTMKSCGSSAACLAMVASYLTGHEFRPDQIADWFGAYPGLHTERLEYASTQMQLPWWKPENWHIALQALKDGCIVIVVLNARSAFTDGQHFIVLTGMTEDGRILVNDPRVSNYDLWNLKDGFANGFTPGYISNGFSGAWVYDPEAMPEDPFIYAPEPVPEVEPRYDFTLEDWEIRLLAKMVWAEARGESAEGQQAVAEVVLNRLAADNFPDKLYNVIYAEGQFHSIEFMDDARPTQTQYDAIERAMYGPYILPEEVVFFARFRVNDNLWGQIGDHYFCYQWYEDGEE